MVTRWRHPLPRRPEVVLDGFDRRCFDCGAVIPFSAWPADATCPSCGLLLYVTETGGTGRYPTWDPSHLLSG